MTDVQYYHTYRASMSYVSKLMGYLLALLMGLGDFQSIIMIVSISRMVNERIVSSTGSSDVFLQSHKMCAHYT